MGKKLPTSLRKPGIRFENSVIRSEKFGYSKVSYWIRITIPPIQIFRIFGSDPVSYIEQP